VSRLLWRRGQRNEKRINWIYPSSKVVLSTLNTLSKDLNRFPQKDEKRTDRYYYRWTARQIRGSERNEGNTKNRDYIAPKAGVNPYFRVSLTIGGWSAKKGRAARENETGVGKGIVLRKMTKEKIPSKGEGGRLLLLGGWGGKKRRKGLFLTSAKKQRDGKGGSSVSSLTIKTPLNKKVHGERRLHPGN